MVCEIWKTRLDIYLDEELPSEEMLDFDSHVHSCPTCGADALARVQMKCSIQAVGKRFSPSPEFRKRVQLRIEAKARSGGFGIAWMMASVVIAVLVVVGLATTYRERDRARTEQVYSEIADLHVGTLATFRRKNALSDIGRLTLHATDIVLRGDFARVHSRARGEWTVPA